MKNVRKNVNAQKKKQLSADISAVITKNTKENQSTETPLTSLSKSTTIDVPSQMTEYLQWHPAFFSEIQIELEEDAANLYFENEHQLGTKPKEIDILIIKKNRAISIKKNIGRIFRKYNIIEYKSPEDSLTINDFYKVLGYTYFYKADTQIQDEIKLEELTITFVSKCFPKKLFLHLKKCNMKLHKAENGIWYTKYDLIPIQFIITAQLTEKKNFWLKNLTNDLSDKKTANKLITRYKEHKNNIHYESVMNVILHANKKIFQEDKNMCDAMMEILQERIDAMVNQSKKDGFRIGKEDGIRIGKEDGIRIGKEDGIRIGEERGLYLAKRILRMNADGNDYETIASQCMLSVDEVKDVLNF